MSGGSILLVENQKTTAEKLQNKLEKLGYHVPVKELKAAIELTLYDHDSQNKVKDIKQFLIKRIEKFTEALAALDRLDELTYPESAVSIENEINKTASSQIVPAGMELLQQGTRPRVVYCIERGLVKLIRREADGGVGIAAIRYPGWLLAASAVVLDEPLPVAAVTVTPCRLRRISANQFHSLIRGNTEISWRLNRRLAREVHDHLMQLTGIECLSGRQRLEELLWQLISAMDPAPTRQPIRVNFPAKYSEIAQVLAVTPQYLSTLLASLEKAGTIKRDKGSVIVFETDKLWHRD